MSNPRGGINGVSIDGDRLDVDGSVEIRLGKPMREAKVGPTKVLGYNEKPTVPGIYLDVAEGSEVDHDKLSEVKNATITVEMKNGKVYSLANAWSKNPDGGVLNPEDGNIRYEFDGTKLTPIL